MVAWTEQITCRAPQPQGLSTGVCSASYGLCFPVGAPWTPVLFSHSEGFRAEATSMLLTGGLEQLQSPVCSCHLWKSRGEAWQEVIVTPSGPTHCFCETTCKETSNMGTTASRLPTATSEDPLGFI